MAQRIFMIASKEMTHPNGMHGFIVDLARQRDSPDGTCSPSTCRLP
jgi:hypothetical protein